MNAQKKLTAKILNDDLAAKGFHFDSLRKVGSGQYARTFCFKTGFFYSGGGNIAKFQERVETALTAIGFNFVVVRAEEHWNDWPKDSYWVVNVKILCEKIVILTE